MSLDQFKNQLLAMADTNKAVHAVHEAKVEAALHGALRGFQLLSDKFPDLRAILLVHVLQGATVHYSADGNRIEYIDWPVEQPGDRADLISIITWMGDYIYHLEQGAEK